MPRLSLWFTWIACVVALSASMSSACSVGSGQVLISWDTGTTVLGGCAGITTTQGTYGLVISLGASGQPRGGISFEATAPNVRIERITVTPQSIAFGPGQHVLTVRVRPLSTDPTASIAWLGTVEKSGPYGELVVSPVTVAGSIGTPGGVGDTTAYAIRGTVIGQITATGDIAGSIVAAKGVNTSLGTRGTLSLVESTGGDITGNLVAKALLGTARAAQGSIGTASAAASLTAAGNINLITARSINANILCGTATQDGFLQGVIATAGTIKGSISATYVDGATNGNVGLQATGSIDADVLVEKDLRKPVSASEISAGRTLFVGGTLGASSISGINGTITVPANGLKGQVIINGYATSGSWASGTAVQVDGITLSPIPYYSQASSVLGGGAVGLAPFHLYEVDCSPASGQVFTGQGVLESAFVPPNDHSATPIAVWIRHYGPIQLADPENMTWNDAVTFELQPTNSQGPQCSLWRPVTDLFNVSGPGDVGWVDGARSIGISRIPGTFPRPGLYRVRLNDDAIVCADVVGNPEVVWPQSSCSGNPREYVFRIAPDCDIDGFNDELFQPVLGCSTACNLADFNGSGAVTVQDLFDVLSAWFAQSVSADINFNGSVTVQDLFDFLGDWFACN